MLFQKSRQNFPFAMTENNYDHCFWISKLISDIKDLNNRETSICKCDTSYNLQKISDSCVKVNIEIIPKESVFSGTIFKVFFFLNTFIQKHLHIVFINNYIIFIYLMASNNYIIFIYLMASIIYKVKDKIKLNLYVHLFFFYF